MTRALAALDALARHPEGMTAKAVAAELGLKLGTTYHLLKTLIAAGYASQDPIGRLVRLGPRITQLNDAYVGAVRASPRLLPFVHALAQATGETANLWSWWGADIVAAAVVEGSRPDRIPGGYVGFTCVPQLIAAGRVLLAWAEPARVDACLARADLASRSAPVPPNPAALRAQLGRIRLAGYALERGELHPDVGCVAAPIAGPDGTAPYALCVLVPRPRLQRDEAALVGVVLGVAQAARTALRSPDAARRDPDPGDPEFQAAVDAALRAAGAAACPLAL